MCQSFTNVRSEFWSSSDTTQTECFEILEKRFDAFVVGAVALTTAALTIQFLYLVVNRYFFLKPLNEVNRNLEKILIQICVCSEKEQKLLNVGKDGKINLKMNSSMRQRTRQPRG